MSRPPACLTMGGSDSCGGAGIQADLRIFAEAGIHGCSVITALTAQNPEHIMRVEKSPKPQIEAELQAVFSYYDVRAIKTGMLFDRESMHMIVEQLQQLRAENIPLVVDPVMVSSSGTRLLDHAAISMLQRELLPMATVVTPNLDEAAVLLERSVDDPVEDAAALMMQYGIAVLLKGGHGEGEMLLDVLCEKSGEVSLFTHPRQELTLDEAHGTGCRLAAAITAWMAKGCDLRRAVEHALHP